MASDKNKRITQIDFEDVPDLPSSPSTHSKTSGPLQSYFGPARLKKRRQLAELFHNETNGCLTTARESPWETYQKLYKLKFGDGAYVVIAEKHAHLKNNLALVLVQEYTGPEKYDRVRSVQSVQQVRHPNFVQALELFDFQDSWFITFEFMPMSLLEIAGYPLLDELRLGSILGQIIDGLLHLTSKGLEHTQLTCSNILIDQNGNVKIWGQEFCHARSGPSQHVRALSLITMELMQGYVEDNKNIGIDNLERWDSRAVEFLSATESISDLDQLAKHPLLQLPWHKDRLKGISSLGNIWASRTLKFPA